MLRSKSSRRAICTGRARKLRAIEKCQFLVVPQFRDANGGKLNLGSAGPALNAQQGSAAGADTNDPTYVGERGLRLPGVAGNYASAPDAAALSITGDIAIGAYIQPDDFTPSALQAIVGKYVAVGDQRSYYIALNSAGTLALAISTDGTAGNTTFDNSSMALTALPQWVAVTLDVSATTSRFWTSIDPPSTPRAVISWTELGVGNTSQPGSIFDSAADLEIGSIGAGASSLFAGIVKRAFVISGGLTDAAAFDAPLYEQAGGTTSFTEDSSSAATVTISQSGSDPARIVDGPMDILADDDYFEVANQAKTLNLFHDPRVTADIGGTGNNNYKFGVGSGAVADAETVVRADAPFGPNVAFWTQTSRVTGWNILQHRVEHVTPFDTADDYCFSWCYRVISGTPDYKVRVSESSSATPVVTAGYPTSGTVPVTDGEWHRAYFTAIPNVDGTAAAADEYFGLISNSDGAWSMELDGFMAEKGVTTPSAYVDGDQQNGRWTGTAHVSTSESRAAMDALIDSSFMALFAGRTYDTTPAAAERLFAKGRSGGAVWGIQSDVADATPQGVFSDGVATLLPASPAVSAGTAHVLALVRDIGADDVTGFTNGAAGTPVTDTTTVTIAIDDPASIGARLGAGADLFTNGEHHGSAFRNCHDGPAPNDAEVEAASRQLAAMTGRYF